MFAESKSIRLPRKKHVAEAYQQNTMAFCDFDTLITKGRPHLLEKICLSLDYETFKNCLEINEAWKTSKAFQKMGKSALREDI